ncbi:MAG: beta-ketoacyl-ACP synthase [Succinivibrio sp.]
MIYINDYSISCSLGNTKEAVRDSLNRTDRCYLQKKDDMLIDHKSSYFGLVDANFTIPEGFEEHQSLNTALIAYLCLQIKDSVSRVIEKYGKDRVGIVLGTSTSGLNETELEIAKFHQTHRHSENYSFKSQQMGDPSMFLADYLNIDGPAYTISTACSSSARSLISAKRLIESGLCDAVIAGGADTRCMIPINGFNSMGVLSEDQCMPFNKNRHGINIGEGGGLVVLTKEPSSLHLAGVGESSDAYHVSSPEPNGNGAYEAMKMALENASLKTDDIGYINLHGTATALNDSMESQAVNRLFSDKVPCSSTKYLTGHTLGAAGIVEAIILCILLEYDMDLPVQDFSRDRRDETLAPIDLVCRKQKCSTGYMMSNSFAFGGNNASVIIGKTNV